jgi:hypothetical protein
MAQIAIPLLLVGTAYLVCNDKSDENEKKGQEGFSDINELKNQGDLLANENKTYYPNTSKTELNINNSETLSSHRDKYFLKQQERMTNDDSSRVFENLAGNKVKYNDIKHNNMDVFYNNKSNGHFDFNYNNILDNYTGQGTFDIQKEEIKSFFKPEDNLQNVYGNQNQSDFLQSRVNASMYRANEKPFDSIKDTPGVNLKYDENSQLGFNTGAMSRDIWQPKTVDDLRVANNPKLSYRIDDHMGPAMQKVQNRGIQGKTIKKTPETFFQNDNNLGMVASTSNAKQNTSRPTQEINEQNRDTTSVSYYGARGNGDQHVTYVDGEYQDPHKIQLGNTPVLNFSKNGVNPTNSENYGKGSYNMLPNNRSTTRSNYFGSVGQMVSNVVQPLVNGLRHTKKTNFVKNKDIGGSVSGTTSRPRVTNPDYIASTTNREMYECKLGLDHLNVQKQDATAYMNTRPVLEKTQRSTMNQSESGPAMSNMLGNKSYTNVQNQRNNNVLYAENVKSGGSMKLFNSNIAMRKVNKEQCNNRTTPFYDATKVPSYQHPTELIGQFSSMPQNYEEQGSSRIDTSLLNAFKNNPYTQPLNSAA